jgi:hypothetical protein
MPYPTYWPNDGWYHPTKGRFAPQPVAGPDEWHREGVFAPQLVEDYEPADRDVFFYRGLAPDEPQYAKGYFVPGFSMVSVTDFEFCDLPAENAFARAIAAYVAGDVHDKPIEMGRLHEENLKGFLTDRHGARERIGYLGAAEMLFLGSGNYTVSSCTIHKIKVLRSAPLWARYEQCRASFLQYYAHYPHEKPQKYWTVSKYPVEGTTYQFPVINEGIGEYWLFAGSNAAGTKGIVNTGFDPSYCGFDPTTGFGKLGYGCNFTDQFAKAVTYAPCRKCESVKPCTCKTSGGKPVKRVLFCSRVLLGTSFLAKDDELRHSTNQSLKFLNPKANKSTWKQDQQDPQKGNIPFNPDADRSGTKARPGSSSVLGLRTEKGPTGSFDSTTFVIADGYQTYPEFLIYFTL